MERAIVRFAIVALAFLGLPATSVWADGIQLLQPSTISPLTPFLVSMPAVSTVKSSRLSQNIRVSPTCANLRCTGSGRHSNALRKATRSTTSYTASALLKPAHSRSRRRLLSSKMIGQTISRFPFSARQSNDDGWYRGWNWARPLGFEVNRGHRSAPSYGYDQPSCSTRKMRNGALSNDGSARIENTARCCRPKLTKSTLIVIIPLSIGCARSEAM